MYMDHVICLSFPHQGNFPPSKSVYICMQSLYILQAYPHNINN